MKAERNTACSTFMVGSDDSGKRVDRVIRTLFPKLPLSAIYRMLRKGRIRVDEKRVQADTRLESGQALIIQLPSGEIIDHSPRDPKVAPSAFDFSGIVIAQSADLLFVNKPRGMLSHGPGALDEIAGEWLYSRLRASLAFRPAPLHRLDRNTSGIVAISKTIAGARAFSAALHDGRIEKQYLALVEGRLDHDMDWVDSLERIDEERVTIVSQSPRARKARTMVSGICTTGDHSLISVRILSGRSHQIRVQAAHAGFPLSGDKKYGGKPFPGGYILHAESVRLPEDFCLDAPRYVEAAFSPETLTRLEEIFGKCVLDLIKPKGFPLETGLEHGI